MSVMNILSEYCNMRIQGKTIPPGNWSMRWEDDGDFIVYYREASGREIGTQSSEIEIHDPAYGKVWPPINQEKK